jgi:hypothetical protein
MVWPVSQCLTAFSISKFAKPDPLLVSKEEMQTLYLDGRSIRRYCFQCRGPKFMVPSKKSVAFQDSLANDALPEKYAVVCKTCGMKYTAKLTETVVAQ